jgi:hypothetical protein
VDARTGGSGVDGPSERALRALARLRVVTRIADTAFGIPGTKWRFGLDALFGLVPGLGDIAGALVAVYALHVARLLRAPGVIQLHLLGNIALDAIVARSRYWAICSTSRSRRRRGTSSCSRTGCNCRSGLRDAAGADSCWCRSQS